jgi:CheY-like chemotaxis protein
MTQRPISILLVDDDPGTRDVFQLVMDHYQMPLITFEDAEGALVYLQNHTPDVIVLDLFLPDLDGYQVLKQIRRNSLAPDSRFVATTAYHTADTEHETITQGFDGYLPKPFDSTQLVAYLQKVIGQ